MLTEPNIVYVLMLTESNIVNILMLTESNIVYTLMLTDSNIVYINVTEQHGKYSKVINVPLKYNIT